MTKRKITCILLFCVLVSTSSLGLAQSKEKVPPQGNPPHSLTRQTDGHWSANLSPESAEGFEVHTVKGGDTLWDITQQYLNDPYLWPQIWEINPNIENPHWIYPGDKVVIKKMVVVSTPQEPTPASPEAKEEPGPTPPTAPVASTVETPPAAEAEPSPPPAPKLAATYTDVYCSGFFGVSEIKPDFVIVGGEESESKSNFEDRDVVYLNKGAAAGVKSGDEFLVLRRMKEFSKYGSGFAQAKSRYGFYYQDIGRVRVILAHENSATAEIVFACEEINASDLLVPNEQRVFPVQRRELPFDRFAAPSNKTSGTIFMTKEYRELVGKGQIVYIDVGRNQNVQIGDYFRIVRHFNNSNTSLFNRSSYRKYRKTFDSVRKVVGELVVLRAEENASTGLVTFSSQDITLGDGIELE